MGRNKYAKQSREARQRLRKERMCDRKRAFDTLEEATIKGQRPYECPHCGKWHRTGAFETLVNTQRNRCKSNDTGVEGP